MSELTIRKNATQAVLDFYKGKPFQIGVYDCFTMTRMLCEEAGHNWSLLNIRSYSTEAGAKRSLKRFGVKSIHDFFDTQLRSLPAPAFAKPGDIFAIEAAEDRLGIGSVVIYLGNQLILSYHQSSDEAVTSRLTLPPSKGWSLL